jgi:alkylation response protein AidB-like acyl-CoA dehydrogenase
MDFFLTEQEKMIQEMVADFAEKEIKPIASTTDQTHKFPEENIKKMAELGLMGMNIPEEYGGAAVGVVPLSLSLMEVGKKCAATGVTMSVTNMVNEVLCKFGREEVKKKYVPKICSGEYLAGSFGLTEPHAGSDPASMRTRAVKDGNEYVLNGNKIWITSAEVAGVVVIWAVTDKDAPKGKRISAFAVENGTPGMIVGKAELKMGQKGSPTNPITLEDVRVPAENLLGDEGDGLKIALMALDGGRIGIGSMATGIGFGAMDIAVNYAKERTQFGKPISAFQAIQWKVADAMTELEAAKLLCLRAAWMKQNNLPFSKEASMAKLYATEVANRACYEAIQILGGYGYAEEYHVERYYRDARATTLYEGTSEIQRLVIARNIIGRFD